MAREPSVQDDSGADGTSDANERTRGNTGLLDRRSYLKMAGVATTGVAAMAATGTATAEDYDVINISAGQRRVFRVGSGETFENKILDCTANGAKAVIAAHGTNWTVRNIGIKGYIDDGSPDALVGLSDRSGNTSTFENVYIGDGGAEGSAATSLTGIWVAPQHSGHIDIKNVHIAGMADNAFYCSAPGSTGSGGTVHIDECYAYNNGISGFRIGDGSEVSNSVVEVANDHPHHAGRGIWAWGSNSCEVRDTDVDTHGNSPAVVAGAHNGGPRVNASNFNYRGDIHRTNGGSFNHQSGSNNPDTTPPAGVPMSAEEAASGGSSSSDGTEQDGGEDEDEIPDLPSVIVFDGREASSTTSYEFTVTEDVAPSTDEDATIDAEAEVNGNHASGVVANYLDAFRFSGELTNLEVDGDAVVRVNGVEVDPDEIGGEDQDEDNEEELENVILIRGSEDFRSDGVTRYEFIVDGEVETSNYEGATIDDATEIDGNTVHGVTANWKDAFRFSGEIEQLTIDGPGTVYINDEEVDPSDFGKELPNCLEVRGQGSPASFEITIDGEIEYDGDDAADDVTVISGTTVQSSVIDHTQVFHFSGALTDATFVDGEAKVFVNDEEIDVETDGDQELLPHALVIDGTEAEGPSTYSFTIDGKVIKSEYMGASIDDEDIIEGTSVSGGVANWLDAFWFDGDIADFKILGDANVHVEYNARDQ